METSVNDINFQFGIGLFVEEIGIGLLVGLAVAFAGNWLTHFSSKHQWLSESSKPLVIVALAFSCFSLAQLLHGSGFIACFVGGLLYGFINPNHKVKLLESAEGVGDMMSFITWGIFGAFVVPAYLPDFTWQIVVYSLLSLTAIRMLPVLLSLTGTDFSFKEKLFVGWFGPRGLASIVFAIIVLGVPLPHKPTIILTVVCTVLLSIIFHGLSARPFITGLDKSEK
jgi:NhaP-type Na+/H+ or K+/H+ antiporter